MKTNIDLACECGAERVCHEDGGDELTEYTDAQLDAFAERIRTAERERCALLSDKEKNSSLRNAEHHQAFDNHNAVAKWESRALACAVIACEIRQAAP